MIKKFFILLICAIILLPQFVHATSNYESKYFVTINELPFIDNKFGTTNYTFRTFLQAIDELETNNYYLITFSFNLNIMAVTTINLWVMPSYPSFTFESYLSGSSSKTFYYLRGVSSNRKASSFNSFDNSTVETIFNCITDYDNCSLSTGSTYISSTWFPLNSTQANNSDDFTFDLLSHDNTNYTVSYFPMLSNFGLVHTETTCSNSNYLCKKLVVNDHIIDSGDYVPTYFDLYDLYVEEPSDPSDPNDPSDPTEHNFTNWIYWFEPPTDSTSILNNLYTLLFLYCIAMITFKIYYTIKK